MKIEFVKSQNMKLEQKLNPNFFKKYNDSKIIKVEFIDSDPYSFELTNVFNFLGSNPFGTYELQIHTIRTSFDTFPKEYIACQGTIFEFQKLTKLNGHGQTIEYKTQNSKFEYK